MDIDGFLLLHIIQRSKKKKKPEKHGFMTFFKNEKHLGESKTLLQQFSSFQGKSYSNFCMSYR